MNEHHYMLYKPYGYISQFVSYAPKNHKQKFVGELYNFAAGTMCVGRLDEKSEGLLLLTTNGKLCNEVLSRKYEKEYYVQLDGLITEEALTKLQQPMAINIKGETVQISPAIVKKIKDPGFAERSRRVRDDRHGPTRWVSIVISEGKYRQIRKMCAAVGFPVLRLIRVRIGDLHLGELQVGEAKELPFLI